MPACVLKIMKTFTPSQQFNQHLEVIKEAKQKADQVLDITTPGYSTAVSTIAIAWDFVFDTFCQSKSFDAQEINSISNAIHKLTTCQTMLRDLQLRVRDQQLRDELMQLKIQSEKNPELHAKRPPEALSLEAIKKIEEQILF